MSDLTERLWPAFFAEVTEQLENLELTLVKYDSNPEVDVHQLFRDFHTIKSSCAMMGFSSMEEVAHVSEDILDLLRNDKIQLDNELVELLIRSVDTLKNQLAEAEQTKSSPAAADDLMDSLRDYFTSATEGEDSKKASAASRGKGEAAAKPARKKKVTAGEKAVARTKAAKKQPAKPASFASFEEACKAILPGLVTIDTSAEHPVLVVAPEASELASLAASSGYKPVERLLGKLEKVDALDFPGSLSILSQLMERLRIVEEMSGESIGCEDLTGALSSNLRKEFFACASSLARKLEELASTEDWSSDSGSNQKLFDDIIEEGNRAVSLSSLMGLEVTVKLYRYVLQIIKDISRQKILPARIIFQTLYAACNLPTNTEIAGQLSTSFRSLYDSTVDSLQKAISGSEDYLQGIEDQITRIAETIEISQDFLVLLTPKAVSELSGCLKAGDTIVEIEADLESAPDNGEGLVDWLCTRGKLVSNRTVFMNQRFGDIVTETTRLRFLAAFSQTLSVIKESLGELDPDHRLYDLHHCVYKNARQGGGSDALDESLPASTRRIRVI